MTGTALETMRSRTARFASTNLVPEIRWPTTCVVGLMTSEIVRLGEFIRRERSHIMARWEARVRRMSVTECQPKGVLIDSLPELLERIAENADLGEGAPSRRAPTSVSRRHAVERLEQGYGLGEVVDEYIQLRACIFERLEDLGLFIEPRESRQLNHAVDEALRETTRRFVEVHERMLRAVDRISAQPTTRKSLDDVLSDILHTLRETAGADVDTASVFLLGDDGRLHMRATVGLEEDLRRGFSLGMGEGFVGRIAATKRPLLLKHAAEDPLVVSPSLRKRGTCALYGVPLTDDGRLIGIAHIGSVQASAFAEEDLMLFRAMANRAATVIVRAQFVEALERTAAFREEFIGVLAHDLRNPLNSILGTGRMLLTIDDFTPEQVRASHQRIVRSAARMESLIHDILDFTRARLGGGFPLALSSFSLRDLAREVVDELGLRASRRELTVDAREPVIGSWDRERIAQVLSNLVSNAVEHSPDGTKVSVALHLDDSTAVVEVSNTGEPIPPKLQPNLFEPFERTTESGGLGLGLYIAKQIVRAHRGSLDVSSDEHATTFTVRLPLVTLDQGRGR